MTHEEYDLVIIGAGIAGLTGAVTAGRLGLRTLILTGEGLGGQLIKVDSVEGYPGYPEGIPGYDLCPMAQEQATSAGVEFYDGACDRLALNDGKWLVEFAARAVTARSVLMAAGTSQRKLDLPNAERLYGSGVSQCASCDGQLFRNSEVAVLGGGDSAMQESLHLVNAACSVHLIFRESELQGQEAYRARIKSNAKIKLYPNTSISDVLGDEKVTGVRTKSDGVADEIAVSALFVYIGLVPNTDLLSGLCRMSPDSHVLTDDRFRTDRPGLYAVGTCRWGGVARASAAAGEGASAALSALQYLQDGTWCHAAN